MNKKHYIKFRNIFVIPTFHSRLEFSKITRDLIFKHYPSVIAVELPNNLKAQVLEAIERLPYLSLIGYADSIKPKEMNFIPIDPADSIIESIRIAKELNIPLEFIDLSVKNYKPQALKLPDDYSLNQISLEDFYSMINENFEDNYHQEKDKAIGKVNFKNFLEWESDPTKEISAIEKDILREMYMASHLLNLMPVYHRIVFIVGMAHWKNIQYFLEHPNLIEDVDLTLIPHEYTKIYNIRGKDARFLLKELPYHVVKWLEFRERYSKNFIEKLETPEEYNAMESFDKKIFIKKIFLNAKEDYETEFKEYIDLHKLKSLFQYTRNISLMDDRILPDLYHFLIGAKNIVDDDYAWKVLKHATDYPYDDVSDQYDTLDLTIEGGIDPNGRYVKLRRKHPYYYEKNDTIPMKERPEEKYPGEWTQEWEEGQRNIVSYPPEDLVEEDYFAFIRRKALKNLSDQRIKIEEFKSSIMDGIAIRETLRNWGIKNKIFVKNKQQIQGKVDTIIVIFDDEEPLDKKYPYNLTWYAEHDKESNMAFYATNPGKYLIGPGISHVEVGGLLSIFPPDYNFPDLFSGYFDYQFKDTNNKAERLLKAGILYSREKFIVYIGKQPPKKYFYSLAGVKHRTLIYIPLDDFSKESLKTIKHIHLLAGREKRHIAHQYIHLI
ncbi:MAG: hypothetical protein GF317_00655 [Candidatus Lokiarchaeota archaeon]|nr:hypothetical protein [Candidatus Lokiarchaeota archaeon]MBD3198479.1 hypothetical protein [Candidatus Lokiarchaeota archaeon]